MNNKYPIRHMYITTDELLVPQLSNCRNWDHYQKRMRERSRHEFVSELVRNNMLNMKTINKALASKSNTSRKALARSLFPSENHFKREVWAFAYMGNGRFVYAQSRQHDGDRFVRMIGRERCLAKLRREISESEVLHDSCGVAMGYELDVLKDFVPDKVFVEMQRMYRRQENIVDDEFEQIDNAEFEQIENEDFSIPDRENTIPHADARETIMYAGGMYDGFNMIN